MENFCDVILMTMIIFDDVTKMTS